MRKQINKWFSHPLILQPWKEAKVQNLSHTDKCNWAEFSQCSLLVTTDVDLNWKVNLVFSVDISLKLLCHEDLELFQKLFPLVRQRSSPPLNLKIFPHIYPASLSPLLVWICILYGMWSRQQKKVGVAAVQKFDSIPRFGDFRSITVRNKHRYREEETSFISWLDSW